MKKFSFFIGSVGLCKAHRYWIYLALLLITVPQQSVRAVIPVNTAIPNTSTTGLVPYDSSRVFSSISVGMLLDVPQPLDDMIKGNWELGLGPGFRIVTPYYLGQIGVDVLFKTYVPKEHMIKRMGIEQPYSVDVLHYTLWWKNRLDLFTSELNEATVGFIGGIGLGNFRVQSPDFPMKNGKERELTLELNAGIQFYTNSWSLDVGTKYVKVFSYYSQYMWSPSLSLQKKFNVPEKIRRWIQ